MWGFLGGVGRVFSRMVMYRAYREWVGFGLLIRAVE